MGKNNNLIYHYCSVGTFHEIIKKKRLWLSDSSYMNDKYEITWTDKVVYDVIEELKKELGGEKLIKLDEFQIEYQKFKQKKHYFVSFSRYGDLLSQWRAYADDSKGVAIGFPNYLNLHEKEHICGKISNEDIAITDPEIGYEEINYDSKESAKDYISDAINKSDNYELDVCILKESATMYKNPSFQEEREVRITYTPRDTKDETTKNLSSKMFRVRNNTIIPYYEFDFTKEYGAIPKLEIILGSKCKLNKNDLEDFLKFYDFGSTKVMYSKSSYR